ncbi:hypothetical protein JCM8097_008360 [Rhodosporidiobolus ruineniae]
MSYPPPVPTDMPVSFTPSLPSSCQPISDTVGLVCGSIALELPAKPPADGQEFQLPSLDKLKQQALEKLKDEAKRIRASGVVEVQFVVEVRAEGVGVLTVDTL